LANEFAIGAVGKDREVNQKGHLTYDIENYLSTITEFTSFSKMSYMDQN
jgi:hypothetical protein